MRHQFIQKLIGLGAATATLVGGLTAVSVASPAYGAAAASVATATETQPVYTWPEFHHDAALSGVSGDPSITSANAGQLGLRWMAPTHAAAFASPIVAWNATLQKTLVYMVNEGGYLTAFDEANGDVVWSQNFSDVPLRATPLVDGSDLWMATDGNPHLYKLNAATGSVECSALLSLPVESSPTVGTPPGGVDTVYVATNDAGNSNGPVEAITASNCHVQWKFSNYKQPAGVWGSIGFGVAGNGRAEVAVGTADPDTSIYGLDALTGQELWRVKTPIIPPNDGDCGAGVTISPAGVNGFADGVAYSECKDGIMFAIDLETGSVIWQSNFASVDGSAPGARSTPALVGNTIVGGDLSAAFALDATTGQELWYHPTGGYEVLASPAIIGPAGDQLVAVDDVSGMFTVLKLTDGSVVYQHRLGGYSVSSVADVDGNLITVASDGYVYDFALGGGNGPAPATTVASPADGSTVPNPNGSVTISGTATDPNGVDAVEVSIQSGGSEGPWWNPATSSWTPGIGSMEATLASPGATSTTWSTTVPVPAAGINLQVFAGADSGGVADTSAEQPSPASSRVTFSVAPSPSVPSLAISSSWVTPGQHYSMTGHGWGPGESVTFSLDGATLKTVTATASGALPPNMKVAIPATTSAFGPTSIDATGTSSPQTSVPVYVSNEWTQWRTGPTRSGLETDDQALGKNVAYNHVNYLEQAWIYDEGHPINSSPAVAQGVAYFGSKSGKVTALNVHNDLPRWTYKAASYVDSSPAVDRSLVIVGTGANSVIALDQATGSLEWTAPTAGAVESSPAVVNGVVYVGTDAGYVYALKEGTGAKIWAVKIGTSVRSSPAVDRPAGKLFVGNSDGAVVALSLASGSQAWSYTTGGAVTATPDIVAGQVIVGSADGSVYSLSESSGAVTWSYATGGAVTASAVVHDYVIVASTSGQFAELDPGTGSVVVARNLGQPLVGVSEAVGPNTGLIVVEGGSGTVWGIKPKQVGDISWEWVGSGQLGSSPTIVNSVVYISGLDGTLRAFTIFGRPVY